MSDRRERATSFAQVVDEYERARPGYPDEVVRWMVGGVPGRVVDLGAGTGKLTASLIALGHDVIAVDRCSQCWSGCGPWCPPPGRWPAAPAVPLHDGSAVAVVVGQAFHWFDGPRALGEIAWVLRPGGVLGPVLEPAGRNRAVGG